MKFFLLLLFLSFVNNIKSIKYILCFDLYEINYYPSPITNTINNDIKKINILFNSISNNLNKYKTNFQKNKHLKQPIIDKKNIKYINSDSKILETKILTTKEKNYITESQSKNNTCIFINKNPNKNITQIKYKLIICLFLLIDNIILYINIFIFINNEFTYLFRIF